MEFCSNREHYNLQTFTNDYRYQAFLKTMKYLEDNEENELALSGMIEFMKLQEVEPYVRKYM